MASFVEQATLLVDDKSTKNLNTINNAIKRLERSAEKLQKTLNGMNLKFKSPKITADLTKLQRQLNNFKQPKAITVQVNYSQVTAAVQKLQQLQKLTKNTNKMMVPVQQPNVNPRHNPNVPFSQNPNRVHVDTTALNRVLSGFTERLANTIENAIISGFQKGYANQDIADTRLGLLNVTPEQRGQVRDASRDISREFPVVSTADVENMFSENLVVAKNNMDAAREMTRAAAEFIRLRRTVSPNANMDQLIDQAVLISKAGEQSGKITDNEGNIDSAKLNHFYKLITQLSIILGKEIDPKLIRDTFRVSGSSKFGLDDRGILTLGALAEEQGSGAGVDLNQLIRQLSGYSVTKKAIANQIKYGLSDFELIETGEVGGKPVKERVLTGPKDQELLTANPLQWVYENVFPAMRKAGMDPNNVNDAIKFANEVTSHGRARAGLTALINRMQDIQRTVDMALALDVSPERLNAVAGESGLLAMQEATSQVIGLAGQIATAFEGPLIQAMNLVRDTAQGLSDFIAGPTGEGDPTKAALIAGGVGVGGIAAVKGGGMLLNLLNPFSKFGGSVNQFSGAVAQFAGAVNGPGGWQNNGGDPTKSKGKSGWFGKGLSILTAVAGTVTAAAVADEQLTGGKGRETINKSITVLDSLIQTGTQLIRKAGGLPNEIDKNEPLNDVGGEVTRLRNEINVLTERMKLNENLAMPPEANQLIQQQISTLTDQLTKLDPTGGLATELTTSSNMFASTFETGAAQITQSGEVIRTAAGEAGPMMGQGILGVAAQFGAQAGASISSAILAAIANVKVNATVNPVQKQAALDTGATGNPL